MYPDLADELQRIISQMVDFLEPFKSRDFYMKEFEGSASIKKVLPALYPNDSDLDYHALPVVHNGEEASDTFLSLRGKSREEQEKLRNGLLVYCKLDTLAMVKIWQKFKEILEEQCMSNNKEKEDNRKEAILINKMYTGSYLSNSNTWH